MLTRRTLLASPPSRRVSRRTPALAQDKSIVVVVDHLDAGLRPVRPHPAAVQGQDRHRREGGRRRAPARRSTPAGAATPTSCSSMPSRQEEKFVADGFGVKRYPGDVQRLRPDRPEERSGRHQGRQGHRRRARRRSRPRARRSSRAATSPAPTGRTRTLEGRRHRHRRRTRAPGTGDRPGHGRGAQHRVGHERLCAGRPRHLDLVQEPRRSRHRRSKATSGCSTSTASCW